MFTNINTIKLFNLLKSRV